MAAEEKSVENVKIVKKPQEGDSKPSEGAPVVEGHPDTPKAKEAHSGAENGSDGAKAASSESESSDEERKAATGIKSEAGTPEMVEAAEKHEPVEVQQEFPSLFIEDDDRIRVEVDILFDPTNGRPVMILPTEEEGTTELKFLKRIHLWADFTHPSYDDMALYREQSMTWDKATRQFLSDPVKMRMFYIRYHLKGWSVVGKDGKVISLDFDDNALTADTMRRVGKVTPSLMDVFLTEFERVTLLG